MIKSELAQLIAEKNNLKLDVAEHVLNTIFDEIIEALAKGNRVELRGFGSFDVRARDPRVGRNPRTGEAVPVANRGDVIFQLAPLPWEVSLPLYVVIFASLIFGVILGWIFAALSYMRKRRRERAQEKAKLLEKASLEKTRLAAPPAST